ncbi:MAG: ComEA family DNA-binding protein [Coriobacteriia bacterium]|nr:ComEA family DNA-binding protein [Coriobacteriia bacterium]
MSWESVRNAIDDLAHRAGLSGVSSRSILLVALLAFAIAVLCAVRWWPAGDQEFALREPGAASAASSVSTLQPAASEPGSQTAMIAVHVVGAVRTPGVYRLPSGSRAQDFVMAAGGLMPNSEPRGLNLARRVEDGEQVVVPTMDEWASPGPMPGLGTGSGAGLAGTVASAATKVDLNRATEVELDALPGVGPSTAAKIVADREANGPFAAPEDLMRVSGIGVKKFEALIDLVVAQ